MPPEGPLSAWFQGLRLALRQVKGNIVLQLADLAGATKVSIQNAAGAEVASIDSAGKLSAASTGTNLTGILRGNGTSVAVAANSAALDAVTGTNTGDVAAVTDATIATSNVTTNDATVAKHGWALRAVAPSAGMVNVLGLGASDSLWTNFALFNDGATPANVGLTGAYGTNIVAARRDHVHALPTSLINNVNVYQCSSALTLTAAYQDVAGMTTGAVAFTPTFNEYALCWVTCVFNLAAGTAASQVGDALIGQLDLYYSAADHIQAPTITSTVAGTAAVGTPVTAGGVTVMRMFKLSLTAGTAYTIKLQAANTTGARGAVGAASQLLIWRIAQ